MMAFSYYWYNFGVHTQAEWPLVKGTVCGSLSVVGKLEPKTSNTTSNWKVVWFNDLIRRSPRLFYNMDITGTSHPCWKALLCITWEKLLKMVNSTLTQTLCSVPLSCLGPKGLTMCLEDKLPWPQLITQTHLSVVGLSLCPFLAKVNVDILELSTS